MAKRVKACPTPDLSPHLTPELLGKAVRAKRTQINLPLADAAALCGVSKQTLSNIENGQPNTQLYTMLQVCAGLGITLRIDPWVVNEGQNEWQ